MNVNKFFKKVRHGFTLVEIMIVVLIIGILLAIAVPNFIRARETSRAKSCQGNLKQVQSAKEQWAMDTRAATTATPTAANLYGTDKYIKAAPLCPSSGTYTIGSMSADPTCDKGQNGTTGDSSDDHVLP